METKIKARLYYYLFMYNRKLFFFLLRNGALVKFVNNFRQRRVRSGCDVHHIKITTLMGAFAWLYSNEGNEYWNKLAHKWNPRWKSYNKD